MSTRNSTSSKSHFASNAVRGSLFSLALILTLSSADAGSRTVRFQNKTGQDVDDLHIETKQGVTISTMTPFTSDRGVDGGSKHNLHGGTVPKEPVGGPPNEATVKFTSTSPNITIKKWWWTLGGNARRDGARVGRVKGDDGSGVLACADGVSNGDGLIYAYIDGQEGFFQTQRGMPGDATAMMFNEFLESFWDRDFDLIHNNPLSPFEIEFAGNVLGSDEAQLCVEILQPDSGLQMQLLPVDVGPMLELSGRCPGTITATVSNTVPGSQVDYYYGFNDAQGTQAPGCSGVILSIGNAHYLGSANASNQGVATIRGHAPRAACGKVIVQAVEQGRCLVSTSERL